MRSAPYFTAAITTLMSVAGVQAGMIVLSATHSGIYDQDGLHYIDTNTYAVGQDYFLGYHEFRSFITFDLTGIAGIRGAWLILANPYPVCYPPVGCFGGYQSPDPQETYTVFEVTTPVDDVVGTESGGVAIFVDLGSGSSYGLQHVSRLDNGQLVSIRLNKVAIDAINRAGGPFAFGGALTTLRDSHFVTELMFGRSTLSGERDVRQLLLVTIPEAGTAVLGSFGLLCLWVLARLRRGFRCRRERSAPSIPALDRRSSCVPAALYPPSR